MLFSRTTALVVVSLFAAGTSSASAAFSKTTDPTLAKKVSSFKVCARPVLDSVSFQPIADSQDNTNSTASIPILFFPYVGLPIDGASPDVPLWGSIGNIMNGQFGFRSPLIPCSNAEDGDFNSTNIGTMVGSCSAISTTINATEILLDFFNDDGRRLQEATEESQHVHRALQIELLLEYLNTELFCTWKMIFDAPKTKRGEKTILSGSSIRTAVEAEEDFVDGRTGNLAGTKPLFISSIVQGSEQPTRGRMLQGPNPFETAYTEYTVTYSKFGGWNPYYLSTQTK